MSGLLNLALFGLKHLKKDEGFAHVADVATVAKEYATNPAEYSFFSLTELLPHAKED